MFTEREKELFDALINAYRDSNDKEGPGLLRAVKAYTGATRIKLMNTGLIIDYGSYTITYSRPAAYLD